MSFWIVVDQLVQSHLLPHGHEKDGAMTEIHCHQLVEQTLVGWNSFTLQFLWRTPPFSILVDATPDRSNPLWQAARIISKRATMCTLF